MGALLFLLGSALLGIGLLRRTVSRWVAVPDLILWGLVSGWTETAFGAYAIALFQGRLDLFTLQAYTMGVAAAAVVLWLPDLRQLKPALVSCRQYAAARPIPVAGLTFFALLYGYLFGTRMFPENDQGLFSGGASWSDMCFHLGITNGFLYSDNLPPRYLAFPPALLRYPFLPDFQTAVLVRLGLPAGPALALTGTILALVITATYFRLARRVTGSVQAAALALTLFLFNGGLGFVYLFDEARKAHGSFFRFWTDSMPSFTRMPDRGLYWSNVIVDTLLPQRAALFGFALGFAVITLFVQFWQHRAADPTAPRWAGWQWLLTAGCLSGLLPLSHSFSLLALGLISLSLFAMRPRAVWLAYWLPVGILGLLQVGQMGLGQMQSDFMQWQPGWMNPWVPIPWPWFWLKNLGLPLLLAVPAWWAAPRPWRTFHVAFVALFALCVCVRISPDPYNNSKLMVYWYAFQAILLGAWFWHQAQKPGRRTLAMLGWTVCVASGLLSVHAEQTMHFLTFRQTDRAAAAFIRDHLSPDALFVAAPLHNTVPYALAGRPVLLGAPAWAASHGFDPVRREADIKDIYAGGDRAKALLRRYSVDYLYVGQTERDFMSLGADPAFYDAAFPVVYRNAEVAIYAVRKRP